MPYPGRLITLEGIDGAGKSTQCSTLYRYLSCVLPCFVFQTWEPRRPPRGELTPEGQLQFFVNDRRLHVRENILPVLRAGGFVICDRYTASTIAYQQYGHGLNGHTVRTLCQEAEQGVSPDLTLWLDLPVAQAQARVQQRDGEQPTEAATAFLQRVHEGYRAIAQENPVVRRIPAGMDQAIVWKAIQSVVDEWLISEERLSRGRAMGAR